MSGFKLVEAVVDDNKRGRRGSGNRNHYNYQQMSDSDRNYYAHVALTELENLFHIDNLATDLYLRGYMDEDGYIPFQIFYSYPSIQYSGTDPNDLWFLLLKVQSEEESYFLELDEQRILLRLKNDYEKWLLPNSNSTTGKGLPRHRDIQIDEQINNTEASEQINNTET